MTPCSQSPYGKWVLTLLRVVSLKNSQIALISRIFYSVMLSNRASRVRFTAKKDKHQRNCNYRWFNNWKRNENHVPYQTPTQSLKEICDIGLHLVWTGRFPICAANNHRQKVACSEPTIIQCGNCQRDRSNVTRSGRNNIGKNWRVRPSEDLFVKNPN